MTTNRQRKEISPSEPSEDPEMTQSASSSLKIDSRAESLDANVPKKQMLIPKGVPLREMPEGVEGPHRQIRKFCLECVGGSAALVKTCVGFQCPLWAWRFGKNPKFVKDGSLLEPDAVRKLAQKEK